MKKLFLSMSLVTGTSVGAGMLALPMVLCKVGLLPTLGLIFGTWFIMYISGLLGLELNLRAGNGLPLSTLARRYRQPYAAALATLSFIFLIYALLCAYIYGGASVLQKLLETQLNWHISLKTLTCFYAVFLSGVIAVSVEKVLQINRLLLMILFATFFFLLSGLLGKIEPSHIPLISPLVGHLTSWTEILPVLFTSYGFQVIFHTLTNFCQKDAQLLKRAVFWGSLIPAFIYILWTFGTLSVLYVHQPLAYQNLIYGRLEVGDFIQILAQTASWPLVQFLASLISLVAIIKSSIGVGLGLLETWGSYISKPVKSWILKGAALCLTVLPPLGIALTVPQLFLKALRFAGLSLTMVAIFIPLWLITRPQAKVEKSFYGVINNSMVQYVCLSFGLVIVLCELFNLWINVQ